MFKERVKTSAILILILNLLFLTYQLWFVNSNNTIGSNIVRYLRELPIVEKFFPQENEYSIAKENLSKPRKFLINDGSLWMAYYNTDIGFSPIEQRTTELFKGFLKGDITASKKIDYETWESGLESLSIYVEYPVSFSTGMFCRIMGIDTKNMPEEISSLREFVIIPSSEESDICLLVRDSEDADLIYAYILDEKYSLPASDLSVYTSSGDIRYEPAFSTGLALDAFDIHLSPLVLFSDSQPKTPVLQPQNLITSTSKDYLLENFSFNPRSITPYKDTDGATQYIANYATAKIYPDSFFEYTAVSDNRGILLDESGDSYNVLNASIDFAEKTWKCVSDEPLSILVTSDLSNYDSAKPYTFKFDYYCNGRPVEVNLPTQHGHDEMNCAIEMTVKNGRLISYKQYMRSYKNESEYEASETFLDALNYFVEALISSNEIPSTISDIYIGYLDSGKDGQIHTTWLAKTDTGKVYEYTPQTEVSSK